jgi:hypothetical protein
MLNVFFKKLFYNIWFKKYFFIIYFTCKLFFKGDCGGKEGGGKIMLWRKR